MRSQEERNRNPRNEICRNHCLRLRLIIQWWYCRCKSITFHGKVVLADDSIVQLIIWRLPPARNRWTCPGDLQIKPGPITDDYGGKAVTAVR